MSITETAAKTILRRHKRIDSWFASRYGMNLYRGCLHNCAYCDGRAEKYDVRGEFGQDVEVKTNAPEVLSRELDPAKKRKPLKRGYVFLGGGVNDAYQPVEKKYQLTRQVLEILYKYDFPVHILTKSTLVKRDLDLILALNARSRVIVSMSFSSVNDEISAIFEPGVPPPSERLETLKFFREKGLACGMYLMPVIPYFTDKPDEIDNSLRSAVKAGLDFVIFGGMTLKYGRQRDHYYRVLRQHAPALLHEYNIIYPGDPYGQATPAYYQSLHELFYTLLKQYKIPCRIPSYLYNDIVDENDRVVLMLDHLDYFYKLEGKASPFGYAAHMLSQVKEPFSSLSGSVENIRGVGKKTAYLVAEILKTRKLSLLKQYNL